MKQRILAFLEALQFLAKYDKAALVAAMVSAVTLLALRFGLNLNASDVAYLSALFTAAVGAFTHVHFGRKAKARRDSLLKAFSGPILHAPEPPVVEPR